MKLRTRNYLNRKRAFRVMLQFRDIKSFLWAGFVTSKNMIVKRDVLETIMELDGMQLQRAR